MTDVAHFRVKHDERREKNQMASARGDQIFVTLPGPNQFAFKFPGVKAYNIESSVDGVDIVTLTFVASTEIEWPDKPGPIAHVEWKP